MEQARADPEGRFSERRRAPRGYRLSRARTTAYVVLSWEDWSWSSPTCRYARAGGGETPPLQCCVWRARTPSYPATWHR